MDVLQNRAELDRDRQASNDAYGLVKSASEIWVQRLIDHSRNNSLLFYRDLKSGTLDLTNSPAALKRLCNGQTLKAEDLVPPVEEQPEEQILSGYDRELLQDDARQKLRRSLLTIQRKATLNHEEKGIETLYLAIGMATWPAADQGRPYMAPVLLLPIRLISQSRIGYNMRMETGEPQANIVLLYVLENEYGLKLDADELRDAASQENEQGKWLIEPQGAYGYLQQKASSIRGFSILSRAVLGNFQFAKMAMVDDLRHYVDQLAMHPLIAAMAGHAPSRRDLAALVDDFDPRSLDDLQPEDEFLILDADSSQHRAIRIACNNSQNGVIQGPPGTGKSQTIANLIAELAAQGKRVLFVAEKRAALEAVLKRLVACGLGHLALDLHGASISKKEVMARIADTLTTIQSAQMVDTKNIFRDLSDRRGRLNEHAARMNKPRPPTGYSVHRIQGLLLRVPESTKTTIRFRSSTLQKLTQEKVHEIKGWISEAAAHNKLFLGTDPSPWNKAEIHSGNEAQQVNDAVRQLAFTIWPSFERALSTVIKEMGIDSPESLDTCRFLIDLLQGICRLLTHYPNELFNEELDKLSTALVPAGKGTLSTIWAMSFNKQFRDARAKLRKLRKTTASTFDLLCEVNYAQDLLKHWCALNPSSSLPLPMKNKNLLVQALEELDAQLPFLINVIFRKDLPQATLADIKLYLNELADDNRTPYKLPGIYDIHQKLIVEGLEQFIGDIRENEVPPELWTQRFEYAWLASALEQVYLEDGQITAFNGRLHEKYVEEFIDLDKKRLQLAADRVRRIHGELTIKAMNEYPDQADLVRREANKRSRHIPLRQLLSRAPDVLTRISPCWIASPLSVSHLLDGNKRHFDVVLFDEASQILQEEAVPSLFRASQAVVAGDRHQLPPTTFFATAVEGEDDDEDGEDKSAALEAVTGFESLLDTLSPFLPNWMLEWHYRSKDERLIAFSNHHIYDDRLVTFPGTYGQNIIRHILVPHDPGLSGQDESASREVEEVIRLVFEHAETRPDETLGVITMGVKHANRIQAVLDRELENRAELAEYFSLDRKERFFIKNLETVQGDERDAIILSIGYGKNADGTLPHRFGPLTQDTGHRRLNVAVTRARCRISLVSSFSHFDVDLSRAGSRGVQLLKAYLEYAAGGGNSLPRAETSGEVGLNPFEADIKDALESRGIRLLSQYGASRYRIDLVAMHPEKPGRPVLAIECDGASYHSCATARDRDRIRQQQLMNLGWRFHRIWSTDWFTNREEEIARVLSSYEDAVRIADIRDNGNIINSGVISSSVKTAKQNEPKFINTELKKMPQRDPLPAFDRKSDITAYTRFELRSMAEWAMSDGLLRTDEELMYDMRVELGYKKLGARMRRIFEQALKDARSGQKHALRKK